METLLLKKKYQAKKPQTKTKVKVSINGRATNFPTLIEELNVNFIDIKPVTLTDDWSNFTNSLCEKFLDKISI